MRGVNCSRCVLRAARVPSAEWRLARRHLYPGIAPPGYFLSPLPRLCVVIDHSIII